MKLLDSNLHRKLNAAPVLILAFCLAQLLLLSTQDAMGQSASLTAATDVAGPSDSITVFYRQPDPTGNDWVSLHSVGQPDSEYYNWKSAPGSEGSLTFAHPRAPGVC